MTQTTERPGVIRRVLSFFWKLISWIRIATLNLIFLVIIGLFFFAADNDDAVLAIPDATALRIAPSGQLVDQRSYIDPMAQLIQQTRPEEVETLVRDLTTALQRAATDKRITALVLDLSDLQGGGISKLEEIGSALVTFRESGKPVIAVSDNYSQDQYYLASYADTIYLNPMGSVMITGYGSYRNYFKNALDKLQLNFHVFRVGQFKDAVEPYLQDHMSDASREHNQQWLDEIWQAYQQRVESLRQLPAGSLNDYVNHLDQHMLAVKGDSAMLALKKGLVDKLANHHDINQTLSSELGVNADSNSYQALDYWDYLDLTEQEVIPSTNKIGLLIASGTILDGEQPDGSVGGDSLAQLIRETRNNKDIKALVVRIDSPGGSAFASELIRQELSVTLATDVPVIVSMGSVAASGGYWMAMAADEVWATPTTITGSIGVFSAFPTIENALSHIGINTDGVGTTAMAGALRIDRPLSPLAANVLQQSVDNIYLHFLALVANSRQSTPEKIHSIAQGHVWTGATAQRIGLVDQLGTLDDAIASAATQANLHDYQVEVIHPQLSAGEKLLQQLTGGTAKVIHLIAAPNASAHGFTTQWQLPAFWQKILGPLTDQAQMLIQMNDPRGLYAQCVECTGI